MTYNNVKIFETHPAFKLDGVQDLKAYGKPVLKGVIGENTIAIDAINGHDKQLVFDVRGEYIDSMLVIVDSDTMVGADNNMLTVMKILTPKSYMKNSYVYGVLFREGDVLISNGMLFEVKDGDLKLTDVNKELVPFKSHIDSIITKEVCVDAKENTVEGELNENPSK